MKSTYGSLAFDLDKLARERQLEEAAQLPKEQSAPQPKPQPRYHAKARPQPLLIGSISLLLVLVVMLMVGYVRLTKLSASVSAIKSNIALLESENVSLMAEYERTYDLATIKQVAEESGMIKPTSGQIEYIDVSSGDTAVVYRAGTQSILYDLLAQIKAKAADIVEFFQ